MTVTINLGVWLTGALRAFVNELFLKSFNTTLWEILKKNCKKKKKPIYIFFTFPTKSFENSL